MKCNDQKFTERSIKVVESPVQIRVDSISAQVIVCAVLK
jgi:hypothetical protein